MALGTIAERPDEPRRDIIRDIGASRALPALVRHTSRGRDGRGGDRSFLLSPCWMSVNGTRHDVRDDARVTAKRCVKLRGEVSPRAAEFPVSTRLGTQSVPPWSVIMDFAPRAFP